MNSSLLLTDVTCIDHAFITPGGKVCGRSYFASFVVTGSIEEQESVVVDFSNIKKTLKNLIDNGPLGREYEAFDHRLWVAEKHLLNHETWQRVAVVTDELTADLAWDAVRVVPEEVLTSIEKAEVFIGEWITKAAHAIYPHVADLQIRVTLSTRPHLGFDGACAMFSYVHGLKSSSSYGCQNLLHGHTSYIQLLVSDDPTSLSFHRSADIKLAQEIAEHLNEAVFVFAENRRSADAGRTHLAYDCARGRMEAELARSHKVIVLETETTVEYLCNYVDAMFGQRIKDVGCYGFVVSEGLAKGSVRFF